MPEKELKCNGSVKQENLGSDGMITYKRRRRSELGARSASGEGHSASEAGKLAMKEQHETTLPNSCYEQDGTFRIDRHWRNVLEHVLTMPDVSKGGGILHCVQDALTSSPFQCLCTKNVKTKNTLKDIEQTEDVRNGQCEVQGCRSMNTTLNGSNSGRYGLTERHISTTKCQNILLDVLLSEKFALLCDLLWGNFQDGMAKNIFNLSLINSKMKNGVYEQSSSSFNQDIQQVWEKFQILGQEMALLASSLRSISQASYEKQVGEDMVQETAEEKFKGTCFVTSDEKNSMGSNTTTQFPNEPDSSSKPDQNEASGLHKVCTCKQCGLEADGGNSLICDGCEGMYHISCIQPSVKNIPTRSWYCVSCVTDRRETADPLPSDVPQDNLHQNCAVCDRLDLPDSQKHSDNTGRDTTLTNNRESSVSSMEADETLEPSRTAMLRLCKHCGSCEDEDKRFLVCGNPHCLYKFYHIRCLKTSQIAIHQQKKQHCWYCPSCLCRACLSDKDDDKIVMCDGCDEAYHTYCMKPPRTSIPEGKWFCAPCNVKRARHGMRLYEQWIIQQYSKGDARQPNGAKRSVDMLLSAADKLSSEERQAAGGKEK